MSTSVSPAGALTPKEEDARTRQTIVAALASGDLSAVAPLLELIVEYALPFRTRVSAFGPEFGFNYPTRVCVWRPSAGAQPSFIVADTNRFCFYHLTPDGTAVVLAGVARDSGFCSAAPKRSKFESPHAICVDPTNSQRVYLSDDASVRVLDCTAAGGGTVSLLAGARERGYADESDPYGPDARFNTVSDLVCTRDGTTLYVCDTHNACLRTINTATGRVARVAGDRHARNRAADDARSASFQYPTSIAFDRAPGVAPDSALYVVAIRRFMRFDITSDAVTLIPWAVAGDYYPQQIACAPNGHLLFTCLGTHSLYAFNPATGAVQLLAGTGTGKGKGTGYGLGESAFESPQGIALIDEERCLMLADSWNRVVRRVTLPPELFDTT